MSIEINGAVCLRNLNVLMETPIANDKLKNINLYLEYLDRKILRFMKLKCLTYIGTYA